MMTGHGDESIAVRAMKLGAQDYLPQHKFTPQLLVSTMQSAIIYEIYIYIKNVQKSGRWDSNPRRSPWEGDILPLNYTRKLLLY